MTIAHSLANYILQAATSSIEPVELFVESSPSTMPFSWPSLPNAQTIAVMQIGARTYTLLKTAPASATEIRRFYLNRLRLEGWLVCESAGSSPEGFGLLRSSQKTARRLQMSHLSQSCLWTLTFEESDSSEKRLRQRTETTYSITVKELSNCQNLGEGTSPNPINWTPMPVLKAPENSRRHSGHRGASDLNAIDICFFDNTSTVDEIFASYQAQIDSLSWQQQEIRSQEKIACGRWYFRDSHRRDWRLFLSVSSTLQPATHLVVLSIDAVPMSNDRPFFQRDALSVPVSLVESLMRINQPEAKLYIGELPEHLQQIPLLSNAEMLAVVEKERNHCALLLRIEGAAEGVYDDVCAFYSSQGWIRTSRIDAFREIGFIDSGFHPKLATVFGRENTSYNSLKVRTRPLTFGNVLVELLFESQPEKQLRRTESFSSYKDDERNDYPVVALQPHPAALTYADGAAIGGQNWSSSAIFFSDLDSKVLMTHYAQQLAITGWRQLAAQTDTHVSHWQIEDKHGRSWEGLLWVTPQDSSTGARSVSFHSLTANQPLDTGAIA